MKILVTGRNGQVGYELTRSLQSLGKVIALDRSRMDLANLAQVRQVIREVSPDIIVNPAAYTAVDKAESEVALAMRINAEAPAVMAEEAALLGAFFVHYSTDYVFDGSKDGPYREEDAPNPLNVYGKSKLAGEKAIAGSGAAHLILRTSWVYGARGKNFLLTMQKLAKEKDELRIVNDQRGAPTWCRTIADATANALVQMCSAKNQAVWRKKNAGIYHLTAQGETTWHGFAQRLFEELTPTPRLIPISSASYPTPATRPLNSRLSCERWQRSFCSLPNWKDAVSLCVEN